MRALALAVVVGTLAVLCPPASSALAASADSETFSYVQAVDAEVVRGFDPPSHPFGTGNRGIKYATAPGDPVRTMAPGRVRFAGQVGGLLHVTVEHPDQRLSSYSGVAAIEVRVGQEVNQGDVVATAGDLTHIGVRENGSYIDPDSLINARVSVRLIPESPVGGGNGFRTPGQERAALMAIALEFEGGGGLFSGIGGLVSGAIGGLGGLVSTAWQAAPFLLSLANPLLAGVVFDVVVPLIHGEMPPLIGFGLDLLGTPVRVAWRGYEWVRHRMNCTPGDVDPPPPSDTDRVAVLIGGLDSTSESASIGRLRTGELGYGTEEVVGFSYAGGQTPQLFGADPAVSSPAYAGEAPVLPGAFDEIATTPYTREDSSTELTQRGILLADLLTDLAEADPEATVDLYAHSQGGLVVRLALHELSQRPGGHEVIGRLGLVATMGTPHRGSDLAAVSVVMSSSFGLSAGLRTAQQLTDTTLHPRGTNVGDLARWSETLNSLATNNLPDGPTYLTLGNRTDLIVTDARARLDGVPHVTLNGMGLSAHSDLPGQDDTTRELALALAGLPPTCQGLGDFILDVVITEGIQAVTTGAALVVSAGTLPKTPLDFAEPLVSW